MGPGLQEQFHDHELEVDHWYAVTHTKHFQNLNNLITEIPATKATVRESVERERQEDKRKRKKERKKRREERGKRARRRGQAEECGKKATQRGKEGKTERVREWSLTLARRHVESRECRLE